MKGNWFNKFKVPIALLIFILLVFYTATSLAQEAQESDVIVMSRADLEAIKAEYTAMREQVKAAKRLASICNAPILYDF